MYAHLRVCTYLRKEDEERYVGAAGWMSVSGCCSCIAERPLEQSARASSTSPGNGVSAALAVSAATFEALPASARLAARTCTTQGVCQEQHDCEGNARPRVALLRHGRRNNDYRVCLAA